MPKISSCLWFDNEAEDASKFYTSLFAGSRIERTSRYTESGAAATGQKKASVQTIEFKILGHHVMGLNGGPHFKHNGAISFFVSCKSEEQIDDLWKKLSEGGKARFKLDQYPWAKKYAWTSDRFGVEWQLILGDHKEKIAPAFLFSDKLVGRGEEAVKFYTSLFENSKVETMARDEKTNAILHCRFQLAGEDFVLMEGPSDSHFSNAFSIVVTCKTQNEVDLYWRKLSEGGSESQCGWLKDQFGVSWQIVPEDLINLITDPQTSERAMKAMLPMKKIDLEKIRSACGVSQSRSV